MDHKSWHWRNRSSEKTIVTSFNSDLSPNRSGDEINPTEKDIMLGMSLESLNEKLASVLHESEAKDALLAVQAKVIEEALAVEEKAEEEALSLRQELDDALERKIASNERLSQLNTALKKSMQQLSSIREEHEQTSREFEKAQKRLEEKLTEKSKNLANVILENAHLNKAVIVSEKLIQDLSKQKSEAEEGFKTLMSRLDSVEKENAFLKYEFRMLEKELGMRNEEMEFHRRSAEVSNIRHMETLKKVKKMEAECQRLRVLIRKRLPGPFAIAKIKGEAFGMNHFDLRTTKMKNAIVRDSCDISSKKDGFLIDRLYELDEENKSLKEILAKKDDELRSSLALCAQTSSDFTKIEAQLEELSKGQKLPIELATSKGFSPISSFRMGNDFDHFENQKLTTLSDNKSLGGPDMSLMDDFIEMEKLAIVAVDDYRIDSSGKELVPVEKSQSNDNWLENVLKLILDQNHISKVSLDDLLEDIRISLTYVKSSNASDANKGDSIQDLEKDESEQLINQLQESEVTIGNLRKEIEALKESKGFFEDEIKNEKLVNEDLEAQLNVSNTKLSDVLQKLSALEFELEDRSSCYEELEATCLELQLQLESVNKEVPKNSTDQEESLLQTGWEITSASSKLAECQETIFSLEKQLKTLSSPKNDDKNSSHRTCLRDQMLAEDEVEPAENPNSPKTKQIIIYEEVKKPSTTDHFEKDTSTENKSSMAIIASKKRGGGVGYWKKLFFRRKRGSNMKTPRFLAN